MEGSPEEGGGERLTVGTWNKYLKITPALIATLDVRALLKQANLMRLEFENLSDFDLTGVALASGSKGGVVNPLSHVFEVLMSLADQHFDFSSLTVLRIMRGCHMTTETLLRLATVLSKIPTIRTLIIEVLSFPLQSSDHSLHPLHIINDYPSSQALLSHALSYYS